MQDTQLVSGNLSGILSMEGCGAAITGLLQVLLDLTFRRRSLQQLAVSLLAVPRTMRRYTGAMLDLPLSLWP